MGVPDTTKLLFRGIAQLLFFSVMLLCLNPANAYLNRSYSTLEESKPFNGDFVDILGSGKLRILLTRDFSSADYLPRRASPLACLLYTSPSPRDED